MDTTINQPFVTVLIPVYNAAMCVEEAILSILSQTYPHFELLLIDDGSTDNSLSIIKSITDNRIVLIALEKNQGLVNALNTGIDKAKGKYILRMDADDIALPNRIEKQVAFMESNEGCILCGTAFESFSEIGRKVVVYPQQDMEIRFRFLYQCPFAHPTVIMRTALLNKYNLRFSANHKDCEDLELWIRMGDYGQLANLPDVLLKYRVHDKSLSQVHSEKRWQQTKEVIINFWNRFDNTIQLEDFETIYNIFYREFKPSKTYLYKASALLEKRGKGKKLSKYFSNSFFTKQISRLGYHLFYNSGEGKFNEVSLYKKKNIPKTGITQLMWLKLIVKKIVKSLV